ncbi:MAG TPA: hypothetical protein VKE97_06905 [Acidimicrobiia bacterium]|nr:hypothetical protein [Acidimicrobiia bacterium]
MVRPSGDGTAPIGTAGASSSAVMAVWIVGAGWAVVLLLILRQAVFVSDDSVSNYGHVWFVSDRIWRLHHLPWAMPVIGHGKALAFPYAFVPWLSAALLRPLLGDWVVTLWLVLGTVALIGATFWAFPELRRGWWAAAVLVNPAVVVASIIGQLPFLWGASMLVGAVGAWRRRRYALAALLAGLGQATHPAVVLPIGLLLVAFWWRWEPDRAKLLRYYALSLIPAIPAAWLVIASPVFVDSSPVVIATAFIGTVAVRSLVLVVPIALVAVQRRFQSEGRRSRSPARIASGFFAMLLLSNIVLMEPLEATYSWGGLNRKPDTHLLSFIKSSHFEPGATYRLLRAHDGKIGMYQLVEHRARLDSEFFPESIARNSWPDVAAYSQFLKNRRVDYVIIFGTYDREWRTNEHDLLRELVNRSAQPCVEGLVAVHRVTATNTFDVYRIRRDC